MRRVVYDTPGLMATAATSVGTRSSSALATVQLRPPNFATASEYGKRSTEPIAAGTAVSRNLPAGSTWYDFPRNSTITDHRLQIEKPTCSENTEKTRFRR